MPDESERLWCARCNRHVAVFNDTERERLHALYVEGIQNIKKYRERTGSPLKDVPIREVYAPLYNAYIALGGDASLPPAEILKHARSRFGPPCAACGLEYQTPLANWCVACGAKRER